jgi:predicted metal-binding membrane protein
MAAYVVPQSARATRFALVAALLALSVLAWVWLYPMHMAPMRGVLVDGPPVEGVPWAGSKALFLFAMWSVMMAGMMIPSALPMVLAVERIARDRGDGNGLAAGAAFVLAYVFVWTGFSAIATAAQWAADRSGLLSGMMASANPWLSSFVLIAAGLFQFTPLKRACLGRCRSPMAFLLTEWRPGPAGALITGLRHGAYCVGCCWVLMALFLVFGTMNLLAAAGLAALVLAEKALPGGAIVGRAFGIGFAAAGVWVLLRSLA